MEPWARRSLIKQYVLHPCTPPSRTSNISPPPICGLGPDETRRLLRFPLRPAHLSVCGIDLTPPLWFGGALPENRRTNTKRGSRGPPPYRRWASIASCRGHRRPRGRHEPPTTRNPPPFTCLRCVHHPSSPPRRHPLQRPRQVESPHRTSSSPPCTSSSTPAYSLRRHNPVPCCLAGPMLTHP
jgi:hypothetical protein